MGLDVSLHLRPVAKSFLADVAKVADVLVLGTAVLVLQEVLQYNKEVKARNGFEERTVKL